MDLNAQLLETSGDQAFLAQFVFTHVWERFEMDKMKLIISTGKLLGSNPLQSSWM